MTGSETKLRTLEEIERDHILHALYVAQGNIALAARLIGVARTMLSMRLVKYRGEGIVVPCACQWRKRISKHCMNHPKDPSFQNEGAA